MREIKLFETNEIVNIDEEKIIYCPSYPDLESNYEEIYFLEDGRKIGYDEKLVSWVVIK